MIEIARLSPLGMYRVFFGSKLNYFELNEVIKQLKSGKTLIRWGDGETALARDKDIWFQSSNSDLTKQFNNFWVNQQDEIVFSLPRKALEKNILQYLIRRHDFWKEFSSRVYFASKNNLVKNRRFAESHIWYENFEILIPALIEIIKFKPVLLIASDLDIFKHLNNTFSKLDFIPIPKKETFGEKDSITDKIDKWVDKNSDDGKPVILLAAGPVGKLIAYDKNRIAQFVDIGYGFAFELGKDIIIVESD
jgi:hypothetical protein